jgi:hypothetical protein
MNSLRFNGSSLVDTCSAETSVPWMMRMSTPASRITGASDRVCCGDTRTATVTPPSRMARTRSAISSGLIGSA